MDTLFYFVSGLAMVSSSLPYCYQATITVKYLEENSRKVYNSKWYKLPVKQQMNIKLLIIYSQITREISGYGYIACSMPIFLRVS